jgi:hypothetical protein
VNLSSKVNTCTSLHLASSDVLSLTIFADPVAAGSFTVVDADQMTPASGQAEADFNSVDATCSQHGVSATAKSGTVVVTQATSSTVSGTFDLLFGTDHLTGSFDSTVCSTDPSTLETDGGQACNP